MATIRQTTRGDGKACFRSFACFDLTDCLFNWLNCSSKAFIPRTRFDGMRYQGELSWCILADDTPGDNNLNKF